MHFRPLLPPDQKLLWDLLYISLWDPPSAPARPIEVLDSPHVRIYAEDWGRTGDIGVMAQVSADGSPVGACWMRSLTSGHGLAYLDDRTPQLGIAVLPEYRRRGIGERLMRAALQAAWAAGYSRVALTVHPLNPAITMYERCGFRKIGIRNKYHLMVVRRIPGVAQR